jgi:hypothetical protein
MDARKRKILTFVLVDAVLAALAGAFIFYRVRSGSTGPAKANIHVALRHVESTLTEIDLVNEGSGSGDVTSDIEAHWADAELKESAAMNGFDRQEARFSVTFHSEKPVSVSPGETRGVGWVKLTEDSGVSADFISMGATSEP